MRHNHWLPAKDGGCRWERHGCLILVLASPDVVALGETGLQLLSGHVEKWSLLSRYWFLVAFVLISDAANVNTSTIVSTWLFMC